MILMMPADYDIHAIELRGDKVRSKSEPQGAWSDWEPYSASWAKLRLDIMLTGKPVAIDDGSAA